MQSPEMDGHNTICEVVDPAAFLQWGPHLVLERRKV